MKPVEISWGAPKLLERSQPLVGQSSPYCGDIWRTYCCLTSFFSDCQYLPLLRRYSLTKLCDVAQMVIFCDFFASCISREPRAASEIRTKATPCVEVWQTSSLRWLRLGEEKKKKEETTGQKYNGLPYSIRRP